MLQIAQVRLQGWLGWKRHAYEKMRARVLRRVAREAYHQAGELGEWAREIFARTAWVEAEVEEWNFPLPVAAEEEPLELCGSCGQPLPDDRDGGTG